MEKTAFITGITGQDGSYLAELLLSKGYVVVGMVRRASTNNTKNLTDIIDHEKLILEYGDVTDHNSIDRIMKIHHPDEVYNLAAQSDVGISFKMPVYTAQVVAGGALNIFSSILEYQKCTSKKVKIYQAGSSEMFGGTEPPHDERSRFCPKSPYATSKVAAHHYAINFRESYNLFICNGILMNHESIRRGENFVTAKVAKGVADIHLGKTKSISLGNLEARRDWGFAGDYVKAMYLMLQEKEPDDYVISTGVSHSVRDLLNTAFLYTGVENWSDYVSVENSLMRPCEVPDLRGVSGKAEKRLGWKPEKTFTEMIQEMVEYYLEKGRFS